MDASIKRHPSLQPISRDHGVGLVFAQRLHKAIRASRQDRERLAEQMKAICRDLVLQYLGDEESVLSGLIHDRELLEQFHAKHTAVRAVIEKLQNTDFRVEPEMGLLSRISDALDEYVRWEERILFPAIESNAGEEELARLSELTAAIELHRARPTQQLHQSVSLSKEFDLTDACGCAITNRELR
jgi:hypothetical protein